MVTQTILKNFMQEFMRQKLFFSPEYSRFEICRFYEFYTRCNQLTFEEKIELIQAILARGKDYIELNCVADNPNNELEHVLSFKVDPLDESRWNEFVSNF